MGKRKRVRPYHSIEELRMRKEQLDEIIELEDQEIKRLWHVMTTQQEEASTGKQIMQYLKYGLMAYDGIMTLRKLKKGYGSIFNIFR